MTKANGKMSLERAAKLLLRGEDDIEEGADRRTKDEKAKITLPRVNFLERPLPSWWWDKDR